MIDYLWIVPSQSVISLIKRSKNYSNVCVKLQEKKSMFWKYFFFFFLFTLECLIGIGFADKILSYDEIRDRIDEKDHENNDT